MNTKLVHMVTGAFGYSGKYIARRLLAAGHEVRTLTNSPQKPHPFGDIVRPYPLSFYDPQQLTEALRGVDVLYNTYWVRFDHKDFSHETAVGNTLTLFNAAKRAGVKRIIHISITNPDLNSPLKYFSGKARLEAALQDLGVPFAILRPTVLFGKEDILINNIAWILRHFPIYPLFGDGRYRLQPIFVDDLAQLAVTQGQVAGNQIIDAIGPETFTFRELVQMIARALGKERLIIPAPPWVGYLGGRILGRLLGDVLITQAEIEGLMAGLLYVESPAAGTTKLTEWTAVHAQELGRQYANELARRKQLPKLALQAE